MCFSCVPEKTSNQTSSMANVVSENNPHTILVAGAPHVLAANGEPLTSADSSPFSRTTSQLENPPNCSHPDVCNSEQENRFSRSSSQKEADLKCIHPEDSTGEANNAFSSTKPGENVVLATPGNPDAIGEGNFHAKTVLSSPTEQTGSGTRIATGERENFFSATSRGIFDFFFLSH